LRTWFLKNGFLKNWVLRAGYGRPDVEGLLLKARFLKSMGL
jgi:hypothetical protein